MKREYSQSGATDAALQNGDIPPPSKGDELAESESVLVFRFMLISVSVALLPGFSSAEEQTTGRIVLHYAKMETIEVGDVPGHILGVAQQVGLVLYSAGGVAKKTATFTFDLSKGKGTFSEYSVITDQDGSTLFSKASGTAGPVEDGKKVVIEAKIECVGGTGRYEGFKGTGTVKGERIGDIKAGGDSHYDFTLNCKKQ